MSDKTGHSTRAVHLGASADANTRAVTTPVVQAAAYAFPDLDTWRAVLAGELDGDIYGRNSHPTERQFGERMALLEGTAAAVTYSTGMAAVTGTLLALLWPGDRAVATRDAYGATYLLFSQILPSFGIECVVVDTTDDAIRAVVEDGCDLLYLETPTNPTLKILDIELLAGDAHEAGAKVVVDNTFATPINQNPAELGADLILHSGTKFLCGHGDAMAGVVCGDAEDIARLYRYRELTGPALDPHSAFLMLRSLKTLGLRVERQNATAATIAAYLSEHAAVKRVHYPGLDSHPGHQVARRQMRGFGGVLSFELRGGAEAVERALPRLRLANLAANLGQVETTVGPASLTSHIELSAEERAASGVPDHLVRYAVGIEDVADLMDDLDHALDGLD
ncbi:MAG: cystathionine gamma-synthase family protein [Acidobacteria bacterium]|nr:cystathionine gamma-synthase family protein [Acidobacteriota bacterium]